MVNTRMARIKVYLIISALVLFLAADTVKADSENSRECQVKAAFLYNFINFVDWPKEKQVDSNEPITVGIIGYEDFIKAFEPIKNKKIKNRSISIKYFAGYEKLKRSKDADDHQWNQKMEVLKTCHVLVFCTCNSERIENSSQIIKALKDSPVLTVGETKGFLESGGVINFLMEDEKVRFEINNAAAKQAKLNIRSKLLRLAKRVIEEDGAKGAKD